MAGATMMKHYKDNQNNLFGFEDGDIVPSGLIEITMEELHEINASKIFPLTKEQLKYARFNAYILEADPLFFKFQAGEITKEEWLEKRQEIRERFPYL
jgi:hypothetical protein